MLNINDRIQLLKSFGDFPLAYMISVDNNLERFYHKDYLLGFFPSNNFNIIIANPLSPKEEYKNILNKFYEYSKDNNKDIIGIQINEPFAEEFYNQRFYIDDLGIETNILIPKFNIKGKEKTKLRRWINKSKKSGIKVIEGNINKEKVNNLYKKWVSTRKVNKPLNILLRSFDIDSKLTKNFSAYHKDNLVGFVCYDPIFKDKRLIGYYSNIIIYDNKAPNGVTDLINLHAIERFKKENVLYLSLGLSPLSEVNFVRNKTNPLNYLISKITYNYGENMYSFKGLEFHKKAYYKDGEGIKQKVYLASKGIKINTPIEIFQSIGILPQGSKLKAMNYFIGKIYRGLMSK